MDNIARRLIACAALALVSQTPLLATGQAAASAAEAVPLEVISRTFIDVYEENDVLDLLQEKLGFEIDWTRKSSSDYREQQLVVLASGDYPDVMEFLWSDVFKDVRQNAGRCRVHAVERSACAIWPEHPGGAALRRTVVQATG